MPSNSRYVLISPCRNEAVFMRQTLDSVVAQSLKPARWVIVDDGSTDETAGDLVRVCGATHNWISIVTRADRGHRAVGPGVIDAFYSGYQTIDQGDYDFVCKLDLDLLLAAALLRDPDPANECRFADRDLQRKIVYLRRWEAWSTSAMAMILRLE